MNPPPARFSALRRFSTPWKYFFHAMEIFRKSFPYPGKFSKKLSIPWKTLAAAGGVALAGCAEPPPPAAELPPGRDFAITATLSTNRIRIGDPVELTLAALHREGTVVEFPSPARGQDILVRDSALTTTPLPNGLRRTEQKLHLTSLVITNHVLAENAAITIATPEGLHWTNAYPFVALEVVSSLAPGETEPRPPKTGLARWPAPPARALWIALALLALLAAAFAALRRFLSTPRTILQMAPPVPPHQLALDALADLRAKGWIDALNIEPFYVELSGIVRRYLEARFGLRAPERTTEEFIRDALTSRKLSDPHQTLVAGFLEQSDLVKFARHAPGPADMRNALDSGERLVRETIPDLVAQATHSPEPGPGSPVRDPHPLAGWVNQFCQTSAEKRKNG
jgi:hypothetical protein